MQPVVYQALSVGVSRDKAWLLYRFTGNFRLRYFGVSNKNMKRKARSRQNYLPPLWIGNRKEYLFW